MSSMGTTTAMDMAALVFRPEILYRRMQNHCHQNVPVIPYSLLLKIILPHPRYD